MDTRAMFDGDQYCLRWSEADTNLSGAVSDIRDSGEFCDLTLACDDDMEIMVHRVILAAASNFFRTILNRLPHHHPLIYLRGIKQSDLQSIINFMYHGEVKVAQQDLRSFMMLAQDLKVKGLYQNQDITKTMAKPSPSTTCPPLRAAPVRKPSASASRRSTSTPTQMSSNILAAESNNLENMEIIKIKTETEVSDSNGGDNNFYRHSPDQMTNDNDIAEYGALPPAVGVSEGNKVEVLIKEESIESLNPDDELEMMGDMFKCRLCYKSLDGLDTAKNHILAHFALPGGLTCLQCGLSFNSKVLFSVHMGSEHRNIKKW